MPSALAALVASAVLWFFSTGAHHHWLLAWFMYAPVLAVAYDTGARQAAAAAFATAILGSLTWVQLDHGLLPAATLGVFVFAQAIVFTAVVMGARFIWRRQPLLVGLFGFPVLLTGAEYLTTLLSPHGTFGSIAYSQADLVTVVQLVSVTGLGGVTFLLGLTGSGMAAAWLRRGESRECAMALAVPAAVVAVVAAFGTLRLSAPADGPGIRVGLAAADGSTGVSDTTGADEAVAAAHAWAARVAQLGTDGAAMVVLPEKLVGVTPDDRAAVIQVFARAAVQAHVWLVAGVNEIGITPKRNVALVFAPDGQLAVTYLKQHLLAPFESGYQPGHSVAVWRTGEGQQAGVAICTDMDFPALSRAYAAHRAGLMLVPAWDFGRDGWLHARMAVVRGVEAGFSVVRAAQDGRLTISDPYGRVRAERRSAAAASVLLAGGVQAGHITTIYDRIGDWFAWSCLLVAAGMFLAAVQERRAGDASAIV
ncbi:MAG: hypothetical protein KGN76_10150 [Acidobacteriota bacterium]|nr:hypothetical protein [Acidobacteriota bacterium]